MISSSYGKVDMKAAITLTMIFCAMAIGSFGQTSDSLSIKDTLSGECDMVEFKVVDSETNEELVFANVNIYRGDSIIIYAITDEQGSVWVPNAADEIRISYIGYERSIIDFASQKTTIISLEPRVLTGPDIVDPMGTPVVLDPFNTSTGSTFTAEEIRNAARY